MKQKEKKFVGLVEVLFFFNSFQFGLGSKFRSMETPHNKWSTIAVLEVLSTTAPATMINLGMAQKLWIPKHRRRMHQSPRT